MLFSVIIPTYNYADRVSHAIESVLKQDGNDFEIIVVDDGSTDDTATVVKRYCNGNKAKVAYFYQENKGPSAARNKGVEYSEGEYILFLDADDRLLPHALNQFRSFIKKKPDIDFVFGGHLSMDPDGKIRHHIAPPVSTNREKNFTWFLRKKFGSISHGAAVMQRRIFDRISYPHDICNNEDIVVFAHIFALYNCASFPEPVVTIYKHGDSLRHNIETIRQAGTRMVDLIFDPSILPPRLMALRDEFYAQRCLSQFRSFYLAGFYSEAKDMYHQAIRTFPKNIFKLSYLKKYLRMRCGF